MEPARLKNGSVIALVFALCSMRALAQDDAGINTPDDWPTPGSSDIAAKYKATLEKPPNVEWWGTEIDGIYAPISGVNGSSSEVTGALLDASLRVGYTKNWLHFITVSLGVDFRAVER